MRSSWILGLGWATVVALSCGARTPFDDTEPENAGSTTGSGSTTGANTSGSSTGNVTSGSTSGSGAGGSSVTTGGPGTSGVTTGSGGSSTGVGAGVGATSTVTTTGGTGMGGAGGRGATGGSGGFGGDPGMGGRGAGGNPLLGILPGIRPGPACTNCVNARCNGTSACSSNPACLAGVSCYFAACAMVPDQSTQIACAMKCFNGDAALLSTALQAVTCVYGPCGGPCQARGPGG